MTQVTYLTMAELQAGLDIIRQAPKDAGVLELIVSRPQLFAREIHRVGELDLGEGLIGDSWSRRGSSNPGKQLTLMSSRVIALLAGERQFWPLVGDQLFIDLDLSMENVPPGTRLSIGSAIVEATELPHTGCKKFLTRFGPDALKFVNSPEGRRLQLRGINARVVQSGSIEVGNIVTKLF